MSGGQILAGWDVSENVRLNGIKAVFEKSRFWSG
jgi:hypothetical protein